MTSLYITWDVSPILFSLGGIEVRWYGVMFALAFVISYILLKKIFFKEKVDNSYLDKLAVYVFVAVLVGARLGHCLFYEFDYYSHHIIEMLLPIAKRLDGWHFVGYQGLASHGGAIGILLALWLYSKNTKLPFIWTADRLVIAICFAGCAIRTGNLFNSEIYGVTTQMPWGFIFVRDSQTLPAHPTQLYEALTYLTIGIVLYLLLIKKHDKIHNGLIFGIFLTAVFGMRFLIEFLKNNQESWEQGMALNMGQILSIPFIIAGIVFMVIASKNDIGRRLDINILKKRITNKKN